MKFLLGITFCSQMKNMKKISCLVLLSVLLSACGGGGGEDSSNSPQSSQTPSVEESSHVANASTTDDTLTDISTANVESITLRVEQSEIPAGITEKLIVNATYNDGTQSDITDKVSWDISDTDVATVNNEGMLKGIKSGSISITATVDDISSNTIEINITDAVLDSISIISNQSTISIGEQMELLADGIFSDGTRIDISDAVSWSIENPELATLVNKKYIIGYADGETNITALFDGIKQSKKLTVTNDVEYQLYIIHDGTSSSPSAVVGETNDVIYHDPNYPYSITINNNLLSVEQSTDTIKFEDVDITKQLTPVNDKNGVLIGFTGYVRSSFDNKSSPEVDDVSVNMIYIVGYRKSAINDIRRQYNGSVFYSIGAGDETPDKYGMAFNLEKNTCEIDFGAGKYHCSALQIDNNHVWAVMNNSENHWDGSVSGFIFSDDNRMHIIGVIEGKNNKGIDFFDVHSNL